MDENAKEDSLNKISESFNKTTMSSLSANIVTAHGTSNDCSKGTNMVANSQIAHEQSNKLESIKHIALLSQATDSCSSSSVLLSNEDSGHETVSVDATTQQRPGSVVASNNTKAASPVKEYAAAPLSQNYQTYLTSTPKKESLLDLRILPSKMILDDPLISSIDDTSDEDEDERTSNQVESLDSDEEGTISQLQETKIPANYSQNNAQDLTLTNNNYFVKSLSDSSKDVGKQASTIMKRFMKDVCIESEFKKNHSMPSEVSFSNPEKVKRKIFDVPVSPKLKTRVRERLYTLVNNIEGHKEKIDLEESSNDNIYYRDPNSNLHYHTLSQDILQRINPVTVNSSHDNSLHKISRMSKDASYSSDMGSIISERYGNVMAQMLESQLKTLHIQQENLYSDRISLALQKKEQEIQKRISIYREKLQETIELLEKSEVKCSQSESQLLAERKKHQDEVKQLEDKYLQQYKLLNQEWESKLKVSEAKVQTLHEEVTASCYEQVEAVIRGTQENISGIENNFHQQICDLNTVIHKLRDEIKILEASTESTDLKMNNANLLSENLNLKNIIADNQKKIQAYDENENKIRELEQEVDNYKLENKSLQKELHLCKTELSKLQQNIRIHNRQPDETLLTNYHNENRKLAEYVLKLKSELSKHMEKVQNYDSIQRKLIQLETNFDKEHKKVMNMQYQHSQEIVVLQKHHETAMLSFRIAMDTKQSQAISDALTQSRKENIIATQELEKRYNDLLRNIQSHASAQIEEYKKAVKILKLRIKKMETRLPPNR